MTVYWLPGTNFIPKIGSARVILTVLLSYIVCVAVYCHGLTLFQRLTVPNSSWQCFFHTWCALLCTAMDELHSKPWLCQTHLDCVSVSILDQDAYIQKWCVTLAAFILGVYCHGWASFQTLTVKLILTVLLSYLVCIAVSNSSWQCSSWQCFFQSRCSDCQQTWLSTAMDYSLWLSTKVVCYPLCTLWLLVAHCSMLTGTVT